MDRADLLQKLAMVEQHIAEGDVRIGGQRERITELLESGRDSTGAKAALATFVDSQRLRSAVRDRLLAELHSAQ